MISVRLLALPLVLAAFLALAPAASAAPRKVPRGFHGVMYDGPLLHATAEVKERQYSLMGRSGVETVRAVFIWAFMQQSRGAPFDFTYTDQIVRLASVHGQQVLPVMLLPPGWARVYPNRAQSPPKTKPYLAYLRATVNRYGRGGSFWAANPDVPRRPIRDWQIWNEPNIRAFWDASRRSRYGWPGGYVRLLRASHRTIKRADRRARVVTGGLVGLSWLELRRMYKAGARGSFDTVALHVYPQTEQRVFAAVRKMREVLNEFGDRRKRIYLTETAFPASRGRAKPIAGQRQETPRGMAKRLGRLFGMLARNRRTLGLDKVFWYTWVSSYQHPTSNFEYSGLLASRDGTSFNPQPALWAFRRTAARYQGCRKTDFGRCR